MPELRRCVTIYPPMLDIIMHVPKETLENHQLKPNTIVSYCESKHKSICQLVQDRIDSKTSSPTFLAGGATFNTQKILSRWLQCDFFGIVGHDVYGTILAKKMEGTLVNIHLDRTSVCSTQWALVFLSGDERTLVAKQDESICYSDKAKEQIAALIDQHALFYFVSFTFFLKNVTQDSLAIIKTKASKGFCLVVNLSSVEVATLFKAQILSVLAQSDFVIGNKEEYSALFDESDISALPGHLAKLGCGFAITDGAKTVIGQIPGGPLRTAQPKTLSHELNTNGAGDSFAAGFIGALKDQKTLQDKDVLPLLQAGIEASAEYIQQVANIVHN
ncbi:adenosine kinase [Nematocida homosporus]|uniref:adenosine kinase n=1 Tax=Nematocida homosporus TaxID=1912981 RepID=UPI00221F477E|nr:adenosine kinase [Nematocida homosporus]KAI5185502.1 adenosine kinase [Nematocida homosporus]